MLHDSKERVMRKVNEKPLKVCLRFKEDLPKRSEDALWDKFFDVVGLFDSALGEDLRERGDEDGKSRKQAKLG